MDVPQQCFAHLTDASLYLLKSVIGANEKMKWSSVKWNSYLTHLRIQTWYLRRTKHEREVKVESHWTILTIWLYHHVHCWSTAIISHTHRYDTAEHLLRFLYKGKISSLGNEEPFYYWREMLDETSSEKSLISWNERHVFLSARFNFHSEVQVDSSQFAVPKSFAKVRWCPQDLIKKVPQKLPVAHL